LETPLGFAAALRRAAGLDRQPGRHRGTALLNAATPVVHFWWNLFCAFRLIDPRVQGETLSWSLTNTSKSATASFDIDRTLPA
jgi:hypothetical protein